MKLLKPPKKLENLLLIREAGANIASGGITAPLIGSGAYLIGKGIKEISKEDGNEFLEGVGDYVENIGHGLTGGLFGLGTSTAGQRKTTTAKCLLRTVNTMIATDKEVLVMIVTAPYVEEIVKIIFW
ncbi:7484_t:CDS:2 [Funneliformis mosseae]|uniref:7484_t:CDS:1 n=1 Tax=Funneliformis mosseae TaxID=27381 RepID=A0A9N8WDI2_FUNMO|nr:7484_t:CDS:2 [Funneliformis mosseae]